LRLFPNWEIRAFGHEIPETFIPGALMPGIVFGVMFLWPAIERRITKDWREHNLLNFPREMPWRTAFGVAVITFFSIMTVAGGNDVIASFFGISVEAMTRILRVAIVVVPLVAYAVTYYLAGELKRSGLHPVREARIATIRRTREGGYETAEEHVGGGFPSPGEKDAAEMTSSGEPAGS